MRVLIINKFLYPNGGSETYIFKLGEALEQHGHEVQYFGMEHEGRCVGNRVNAYTSGMDFHGGSKLSKLTYPIKTIYSKEARVQLRKVLDDFKPDVCHLNNFNYQLTPSIILEIVKWRKETGRDCKIIFTAHDYQLVCPNHMLNNPNTHQNCEKCLGGHFVNCMKGKCIHGSTAKSAIGMMEAEFWKWKGTYKYIDTMICCSEFMKSKMDSNPLFATKTVAMHNFIDKVEWKETEKKDYVLYFGRFSEEKGIGTLIKVCKELPDVQFIFAGTGPLEETVNGIKNIKNVGFQKGEALEKLIREARFSIYPSEWYENCPFSVMESQMYGTPVLGANIGGIPELIQVGKTGELFESRNGEDLKRKIEKLWRDKKLCAEYSANCKDISFDTIDEYLVNGGDSCMAGFVLKNTLSDNGGVTRGICKMDEQNNLTEIVETKNIVKTANGAEADGVDVDVDSLVSMNMWGLTPNFLTVLEEGFKEFFEKEVPGNPLKAEYLIPIFIGELLEQGKMSVKVLKTNDTWYGMTYHEDVAAVKDSFKKMLENGVYKADLFADL